MIPWPISSTRRGAPTWSPSSSRGGSWCTTAGRCTSTPSASSTMRCRPRSGSPMSAPERFRAAPKVELHLHAAGSVRPATMRTFVTGDGLPPVLADSYSAAATGEGLPAYLARFAAWDATVRSPDRIARVVTELAADLTADGVSYAEVRLRPPTDDDALWHAMMESAVRAGRSASAP